MTGCSWQTTTTTRHTDDATPVRLPL